jgi:hypothetical protein
MIFYRILFPSKNKSDEELLKISYRSPKAIQNLFISHLMLHGSLLPCRNGIEELVTVRSDGIEANIGLTGTNLAIQNVFKDLSLVPSCSESILLKDVEYKSAEGALIPISFG